MTDQVLNSARGIPLKAFIDIDWQGDVAKHLLSAVQRMGDYEILLRTIGRKLVVSMRKNIMEQTTPEGERWPNLKKPRGKGHNPGSIALFDSGALYDDIQYVLTGPDTVEVGHGPSTFYGRFQQLGTRWIPPRRFIGIREGDLPGIQVDTAEHVNEAFIAEGGGVL